MQKPGQATKSGGFSLVEVVMAIGLVSFSMLIVLGLLPVGLNNVRQAVVQVGETSIVRQVRSDLQQIPLASTDASNTDTIQSLNGKSYYYSQQGVRLASSSGAFFQVTFTVANPTVIGSASDNSSGLSNFSTSALNVMVTLTYPVVAPAASQQTRVFSLLEAGQ